MAKYHSFKAATVQSPSSASEEKTIIEAFTTANAAVLSTIASIHSTETTTMKEIALAAISADPANGGAIVAAWVEVTRLRLEAEEAMFASFTTFIGDLTEKAIPLALSVVEAQKMKAAAALTTAAAREKEADNRASFVEIEKLKAAVARREH